MGTATKSKKQPTRHEDIMRMAIATLMVSPENEQLYKNRSTKHLDFRRLVKSIKRYGIQAPLLISRDLFVISGHQRLAAAIEAGLTHVPCIMMDIRRSDCTSDEWLVILREHNTGREKTLDERVMENIVDIDPDEAMRAVVDEKVARGRPKSMTVHVPGKTRRRSPITSQTRAFADAIIGILKGVLGRSLPVPERAIHYRLLPPKIKTSRGKKGFVYANDERSVKALSGMLTRLRLCGEVPWEWICDTTRPIYNVESYADSAEFLGQQTDELYTGFARDLMQSQTAHYDIDTKVTVLTERRQRLQVVSDQIHRLEPHLNGRATELRTRVADLDQTIIALKTQQDNQPTRVGQTRRMVFA